MSRPPKPGPTANREPLTPDQQALVLANRALARWYAYKVRRRHPGMPLDEIAQVCDLALCRAVQRHDPDRGTLSTAMGWQIKLAVTEWYGTYRPAGYKNRAYFPTFPVTRRLTDRRLVRFDDRFSYRDPEPEPDPEPTEASTWSPARPSCGVNASSP